MKARMPLRGLALVLAGLLFGACSETQLIVHTAKRVTRAGSDTEQAKPVYKVGKPYSIEGTWYYPAEDYAYTETGIASWYGAKFHGRRTANGEIYDMNDLTAAHRTLPLPSLVRVTNLSNGRSLILRINDRGPFARGRIVDVSRRAAQLLGFMHQGTARVRVNILARESHRLAAELKGEPTVASVGTPITVRRLPKAPVSSELLPPPPGGDVAPPPVTSASAPGAGGDALTLAAAAPRPEPPVEFGVVTKVPVKETSIFVQAGAFAVFTNANRARARLAWLGRVRLSPVLVNGKDLFRVRVGPLQDVTEADYYLASIMRAGFPAARIIVD